jgi:hypothetical protein
MVDFQVVNNWKNIILVPYKSIDSNAAEHGFMGLVIAHDGSKSIPIKYPALMSLLFLYLFVDVVGHYSLLIPQASKPLLDQHNNIISENHGDSAEAIFIVVFSENL